MIASFQRQCLAIVHVVPNPQMLGNEKSLLIKRVDSSSTWMYAIAQILLRMWTYKEGEIGCSEIFGKEKSEERG